MQENYVSPKASVEMELLAADKRCISGTAHSLITDHNTTYAFKDINTLNRRREEEGNEELLH